MAPPPVSTVAGPRCAPRRREKALALRTTVPMFRSCCQFSMATWKPCPPPVEVLDDRLVPPVPVTVEHIAPVPRGQQLGGRGRASLGQGPRPGSDPDRPVPLLVEPVAVHRLDRLPASRTPAGAGSAGVAGLALEGRRQLGEEVPLGLADRRAAEAEQVGYPGRRGRTRAAMALDPVPVRVGVPRAPSAPPARLAAWRHTASYPGDAGGPVAVLLGGRRGCRSRGRSRPPRRGPTHWRKSRPAAMASMPAQSLGHRAPRASPPRPTWPRPPPGRAV